MIWVRSRCPQGRRRRLVATQEDDAGREPHRLCPVERHDDLVKRIVEERPRLGGIDGMVEKPVANRQEKVEVGWTENLNRDVVRHETPRG
jgi:hypothetical protein